MDIQVFWLFFLTTALVIISPGATSLLIVSKTASMNARGLAVIFGSNLAIITYFILSGLGLTAIVSASQTAFLIIKWIGVVYLAFLGLSALFSKSGGLQVKKSTQKQQSIGSLIAQGYMIEFANPKAWLYFAALLPTFTDLSRPLLPQFIIMTAITVVMQLVVYGAYGLLAIRILKGGLKASVLTWLNRFIGGALLLAAFKMAQSSFEKS